MKIGAAIFKFLSGAGIEASYHEEIYRMTIVDALTGAHNKRYFLEFLEREIARCARYRRPLSLLMFDIDHFKTINDKHGHLTGDYVLREMSRRLLGARSPRGAARALRRRGVRGGAARDRSDAARARSASRSAGSSPTTPFEYEGDKFPVTVSVGVACVEGEDVDVTPSSRSPTTTSIEPSARAATASSARVGRHQATTRELAGALGGDVARRIDRDRAHGVTAGAPVGVVPQSAVETTLAAPSS